MAEPRYSLAEQITKKDKGFGPTNFEVYYPNDSSPSNYLELLVSALSHVNVFDDLEDKLDD